MGVATANLCVALLYEGVDIWRPIEAELLGRGRYRLVATQTMTPE